MAIFRKIHVSFWSDAFVSELTDKQKLFYLYLLTNERTTQLGVYEITKKQIAYDLGYTIDQVSKLIIEIEKTGRIKFNSQTSEIGIKNWNRYNLNTSSKVATLVNKEKERIKDKSLIDYINNLDTVSILYPQEEEEKEQEEELEQETKFSQEVFQTFDEVLNHFPLHLQPDSKKKKDNWLETIEKLNRIDKIPFEKIIEITKKTREDPFWSTNFLSLTKLRQKNPNGIAYIVVFNEKIKSNESNKKTNRGATPEELRVILNKHSVGR
jgi:hypothetical protein